MMTFEEKHAHSWACDLSRGDVQCPFVTPHGDDGHLNCMWKTGHPDSLPHTDCYNDYGGEHKQRWYENSQILP